MPFVPEQSHDAMYDKFKKRQVFVWSFLIFMTVIAVIFLLYISYQIMKSRNDGGSSASITPLVTPLTRVPSSLEKPRDNNFLLYAQFAPEDARYKLYKVYYAAYAREEIFSFPWSDASSNPSFAPYGGAIAVFPDINKGFLISREGKTISTNEFMPPDRYFSVSPDNKRMFYFKYLSSIGTTALTLRDMEKSRDVFSWPVSSPASQICDFAGWSADSTKAYCVSRKGDVAVVKAFDAQSRSFSVVLSQRGVADASYYPEKNMLLVASPDAVFIVDAVTKERRVLAAMEPGSAAENARLAPDGSRVLFTVARGDGASRGTEVYSVALDGSDKQAVTRGNNARLVSVAHNSKSIILESVDVSDKRIAHYIVAGIDGSAPVEVYSGDSDTQFIGWFESL